MLNQEQQIFEQIKKAKNILITFNKTWNGDALASALAMYLLAKKFEKNVDIIADKFLENNHLFSFLPAYEKIKTSLINDNKFIITLNTAQAKVGQIKYETKETALEFIISPKEGFFTPDDVSASASNFKYDLIIIFDTPDLEAIGGIYDDNAEFFYKVPIINIDHHATNEQFGQINRIELTAIATSEILFNLIADYARDLIDEDIATCLLAGIIAKTKSFKTQNITPQVLAISSQLIAMGAKRDEIVNRLYRSRSLNVLKLWGRVLARLNNSPENTLVWSVLTNADFEKTDATENDLNEVIDELIINIPLAKIVMLIYEMPSSINADGKKVFTTKAQIHSIKNINVLHLAKRFNPQGTRDFARIELAKPLAEAEPEIISALAANLEKLPL